MPSGFLSQAEKAKKSFQRGHEILNKAKRGAITRVMEEKPETIEHILDTLKALGHDVMAKLNDRVKRSAAAAQLDNDEALLGNGADGTPSKKTRTHPPHPLDIPRCVTTLGATKMELITNILIALEPSSLSHFAQRALLKGKQRTPSKPAVSEILSFATGLDDDLYLGVDSTFKSFLALKEECERRYAARGRRCRDLVLPPKWGDVGVFRLSITDGAHFVDCISNPLGPIPIPDHVLDPFNLQEYSLVLKDNFSKPASRQRLPHILTLASACSHT